jgi:hypothetical protein
MHTQRQSVALTQKKRLEAGMKGATIRPRPTKLRHRCRLRAKATCRAERPDRGAWALRGAPSTSAPIASSELADPPLTSPWLCTATCTSTGPSIILEYGHSLLQWQLARQARASWLIFQRPNQ